jgi:hypothetical protein
MQLISAAHEARGGEGDAQRRVAVALARLRAALEEEENSRT